MQQLSRPGAGAILGHEAIILEAYRDPVGIWTIGGGHTAAAGGIAPRAGMIISLGQAMRIFAKDMRKFADRVARALERAALGAQHRIDAMVSFDFNTGAIFKGTVDDKLNRGDIDAAMSTLNAYVYARGERLAGLVKRRSEEVAMYLQGRYPSRKILIKDRAGAQGRLISPDALPWEADDAGEIALDLDRPLPVPPLPVRRPRPNFLLDLFNLTKRIWRAL
jgi:lysozyme